MEMHVVDLLPILTALGDALQAPFDPRQFLAAFSARLQPFVPHDRLVIQYREAGGFLSVFAEHVRTGPMLHEGRYTTDFDPAGRYDATDLVLDAVLAGESMVVEDFQTDPRFARRAVPYPALQVGIRARVAVPLTSHQQVLGALLATSYAPARYLPAHVTAARQVADLIAPFIENTVLLHREQHRRRRLAALSGLASALAARLTAPTPFAELAEVLRPHMDFDVVGVRLLGTSGRALDLLGRVAADTAALLPARIAVEDLSYYPRIEAGDPVLIQDAPAELDRAYPGDRAIVDGGGRASLALPLRVEEQVTGFLFFAKRHPYWYDSTDLEVAAGIAAQLTIALHQQRVADEQRRRVVVEGRARQLEHRLTALRQELGDPPGFERIIGRAPAFREALAQAAKVAPTDTTVLLTGESGTGKEVLARAIHAHSPRAEGPFLAVNCAALTETLVESELFGHERGAFTGADKQKPGRFELAAAGTLFLDEVAELPRGTQAKLLRVLQDHTFERVGGTQALTADIRLLAATNRDLEQAVQAGRFREDLYYRLNVFRIHLCPLRERGDDVLLLAQQILDAIGPRLGKTGVRLSREAQAAFRNYRWPGNVRELENVIERALILLGEEPLLTPAHCGLAHALRAPGVVEPDGALHGDLEPLAAMEARAIRAALAHTKGNQTRAAALLGITRMQMRTRIKRFGLS